MVALCSMLFMQFAVAAYACPALRGGPGSPVDAVMAAMPDCDQVDSRSPDDAQSPALCHAHCQDIKSALDKPEAPVVAPAFPFVSAILVPLDAVVRMTPGPADRDSLLLRITSPPISIRHCCFRI
jgi:hypothetical protein